MCGRYVLATPPSDLVALFDIERFDEHQEFPEPSYNIAPSSKVPVIVAPGRDGDAIRRLEVASWGLVPGWAKDPSIGSKAFNARSETAAEKPMFAESLTTRRALLPADGWYEWHEGSEGKQPYYVHDDAPLIFAGLYAWWRQPSGEWLLSTTILTAPSVGELAWLHPRMPIVLDRAFAAEWLDDDETDGAALLEAAVDASPNAIESLRIHAVDPRVGTTRNNDERLIHPIPAER